MKLSFGMIFSIFLIIIFIAFAFYAITKFIKLQENVLKEKFVKDLQGNVDEIWKNKGSAGETYSLPKKVERICFTDDEFNNLLIISEKVTEEKNIEHVDISKITEEGDYCISNVDGEVKLVISRSSEYLVTITRQ